MLPGEDLTPHVDHFLHRSHLLQVLNVKIVVVNVPSQHLVLRQSIGDVDT